MGVQTLGEFRTEIVEGLQRGTVDDVGTDLVDRWILRAMQEFGYALKFRELEETAEMTLTADTDTLTLPDDFRAVHEDGIRLYGVERFEGILLPETRSEFMKHLRELTTTERTNRPKYYHIFADNWRVRPKADQDYEVLLHYWKSIEMMVDDDDTAPFQGDWDEAILTGALYRGFRHFNEFDRYQNVRNDFLAVVRSRQMIEDLEPFPEGGIHPVTWRDTETDSLYGRTSSDEREYGDPPDFRV